MRLWDQHVNMILMDPDESICNIDFPLHRCGILFSICNSYNYRLLIPASGQQVGSNWMNAISYYYDECFVSPCLLLTKAIWSYCHTSDYLMHSNQLYVIICLYQPVFCLQILSGISMCAQFPDSNRTDNIEVDSKVCSCLALLALLHWLIINYIL